MLYYSSFLFPTIGVLLLVSHAAAIGVSNKVGLGWAASPDQVGQFQATGKVSWYYHWAPDPRLMHTNLEFVPMLWGERDVTDWTNNIFNTVSNFNVTTVLGMNEPDLGSQSNLTPQQGAQLWQSYIQPLKGLGIRLASPVPTNAPTGPQWVADFITSCGPTCTVDIIALRAHTCSAVNLGSPRADYYGTNATEMTEYIENVHSMFTRPIWVTEFACQDFTNASNLATLQQISDFMNETVSWMESTDYVERYSWFGAMTSLEGMNPLNALMNPNGQINSLGEQYIGEGTYVLPNVTTVNGTSEPDIDGGSGSPEPTFAPLFVGAASRISSPIWFISLVPMAAVLFSI